MESGLLSSSEGHIPFFTNVFPATRYYFPFLTNYIFVPVFLNNFNTFRMRSFWGTSKIGWLVSDRHL